MNLDFTPEFRRALDRLERSRAHLFIVGKAGAGKSTLLKRFCARSRKRIALTAPTGVAALNIGGQTVHRFFRFRADVTPQRVRDRKVRPADPRLPARLQTLAIDEVSMLRADLLDCVEAALRLYGPQPGTPFGGVQMVFVGDLHQLPPVVPRQERDIFSGFYQSPYFFSARCMADIRLETIALTDIHRQRDESFIAILNRLREGRADDDDLAFLNRRCKARNGNGGRHRSDDDDRFAVTLTATNRKADLINAEKLAQLPAPAFAFNAEIEGDVPPDAHPTAATLEFRVGAQIMTLNNEKTGKWVNGSIGVIRRIGPETDDDGRTLLHVEFENGDRAAIGVHRWEMHRFAVQGGDIVAEPTGAFIQYPCRPAWAITIHKSQGKTFSRVVVAMDRGAFAFGQTYVALSRCVSLDGLTLLTPLRHSDLQPDPRILRFLRDAVGDAAPAAPAAPSTPSTP